MRSGPFSSLFSFWRCRVERKLCGLGILVAFAAAAPAQALIDYHQHLLMPNEKSPKSFVASDLVKLLDDAHISRALVLSMAYRYGNPNQPPVANEYAHVKAENDWVSQQVAHYPNRLRAFCGVDPLKDYALAEIARCAQDPNLHYGLKLLSAIPMSI
jgi:predicted TIM-barrel fold metal-dependent hydrolase